MPGSNAVIGGLQPGDMTLDLFQRLPAKAAGPISLASQRRGLFRQENMTQSRHEPILTLTRVEDREQPVRRVALRFEGDL